MKPINYLTMKLIIALMADKNVMIEKVQYTLDALCIFFLVEYLFIFLALHSKIVTIKV